MKKILFGLLISFIFIGCAGSFTQSKTNKNIYSSSNLMVTHLKHMKARRFKQAYKLCASLRNGGYSDWRLPTLQEMKEIHPTNLGHILSRVDYWLGEGGSRKDTLSNRYTYGMIFTYGGSLVSRRPYRSDRSTTSRTICVRGQSPQAKNFIYINNYNKAAKKSEEDYTAWREKRLKIVAKEDERRRQRWIRRSQQSKQKISTSSYCSPSEQCYTVINKESSSIEIKCRNGAINRLFYDSKRGEYYQAGAFMRTYKNNFKELANYSCGVY